MTAHLFILHNIISPLILSVAAASAHLNNPSIEFSVEPPNNSIFPSDAEVELIHSCNAEQFNGLTEGPTASPNGRIYFTYLSLDTHAPSIILSFDPANRETTVFTRNAGKANGLAFDHDGSLISCDGAQGGGRRLARWDVATRQPTTVVDSYNGNRLNSPNDLCIDSKGRIYFTDPRYIGAEPRELEHQAVYRVDADGTAQQLHVAVEKPNGVALSPDERTLYVVDHNNGTDNEEVLDPPPRAGAMKVYSVPLDPNGDVAGPQTTIVDFQDETGADGITVDSQGNVYVACRSLNRPGVLVVDPSGRELAFLNTKSNKAHPTSADALDIPSNVTFGAGPDSHSLYITLGKSLYRVRAKTKGCPRAQ